MKKPRLSVTLAFVLGAMLLLSCAQTTPSEPTTPATSAPPTTPSTPTTPTTPTTPAPQQTEMVKDSLGRQVEKPKYGGVVVESWSLEPVGFDSAFSSTYSASTLPITNEVLVGGDWAKGPTGTGDVSYRYNYSPPTQHQAGLIAESWEMIAPNTLVYHIRKGIRWHNKPPMNGRELTADDVVFGLKYLLTSPRGIYYSYWPDIKSLQATDKYTVTIEAVPGKVSAVHSISGTYTPILPREVIEKYGDMNRWEVSCGTGAFMLTDYVSGSSVTFVKNPNYWMKQPLFPQDSVPYVDGIKRLFILDVSTQLAAIRTGKIDMLTYSGVSLDDAEGLRRTNPELKWVEIAHGGQYGFGGKVTAPPFNDVRVRQALWLAIDNEAIAKDLYKGKADILNFPVPNVPEYKDAYIPLAELPQNLRELYEYHPDKAKQLLTEAGYPNGFKTEIVCMKDVVDLMSIVKDYWAKVGVELKIDVKERNVWVSMVSTRSFKHMIWNYVQPGDPLGLGGLAKGVFYNPVGVEDPVIEKYFEDSRAVWPDSSKQMQLLRKVALHVIEQAYYVVLPGPRYYAFWQPWVKEYSGESFVGYMGAYGHPSKYLWLDLDLKEKMTGKR